MPCLMEENLHRPLSEILPIIQDGIMKKSSYFGVKTLKNPADAWVYQEILFETQPDVIVEIGTNCGGSTLMLAHLCDLIGKGRVIGLDLSHATVPERVKTHPRITLIEGDACGKVGEIAALIAENERIMVIEDSSHTYGNTLNVLRTYAHFVTPGCYFIVEDSVCHHGLPEGPSPGPYEAIETFVGELSGFIIDREREHLVVTWNPKGFLKRLEGKYEASGRPLFPSAEGHGGMVKLLKLLLPPIITMAFSRLLRRSGRNQG